jgi:hypothetical protein
MVSKDDVTVNIRQDTFEVMTSAHGKVDERPTERIAEVSFTPSGEWTSTLIGVLFPYGSYTIGQSIFGSDKALVVQSTVTGRTISFAAAALTKMPDVTISATQTALGSCTFTCIQQDASDWDDSGSMAAFATGTYSDPGYGTISTKSPAITWASPLSGVETQNGVRVSFNLSTDPIRTDSAGMVDMTFTKLDVSASFSPVGITEEDVVTAMQIQGGTARRGQSLSGLGNDLIVLAAPVSITLKKAAIKNAGFAYAASRLNVGELQFVATKVSGSALFTVAAV